MSLKILLERLSNEGKIKKQAVDLDYLSGLLEAARRNFEAANLVRGKIDEAAFKLYYDGLLQISRVILALSGYRPDDGEQHRTTFMVAGALLGKEFEILVGRIQKFRVKRNICVYDPKDLISKSDTDAIYKTAREFWQKVRVYLGVKRPQLKLFKDF